MTPHPLRAGVVVRLARYPVKSMRGESLDVVDLDARGVVGDRVWAAYTADGGIASGKTTRRFRRVAGMLALRSRLEADGPVVETDAGARARAGEPAADELLTRQLGQALALRRESTVPHHDESGLHVVTVPALRRLGELLGRDVDVDRFRANIVIDADGADLREDDWRGRELAVGDAVLRLADLMPRCVMVDMAQGSIPRDGRILRELTRSRAGAFGLQAHVARPGTIRVGDTALLA